MVTAVEQVVEVLRTHWLHASMNICICGKWRATPNAGSLKEQHDLHVAQALNDACLLIDADQCMACGFTASACQEFKHGCCQNCTHGEAV